MILNFDVKGLEVVCAAYLSRDPVLMQELHDNVDIHSMNQQALGLPEGKEGRGVAKIFMFRIIYGGMYFHNDPDFAKVSTSRKFWEKKLELFFEKYKRLKQWHGELLRTVAETGRIVSPVGRTYEYEYKKGWNGDSELPATQIKNYIVQGLGADIMAVIRVDFYRRFKNAGTNISGCLVNTVHDSIVLDLETQKDVDKSIELIYNVLSDFNENFEKIYGVPFDLQIKGEMEVGQNQYDMEVVCLK